MRKNPQEFRMDDQEWKRLHQMHTEITNSGITAFNTDYLEEYTYLLTKSLQGKGNTHHGQNVDHSR